MKKIINFLINLINIFISPLKLFLLKRSEYKNLLIENTTFKQLLNCYANENNLVSENSLECIIFSMDRAIQIHSLLSSFYDKVKNSIPIHILYKTSNEDHNNSYNDVFSIFDNKNIHKYKQTNYLLFKDQLISILENIKSKNVFFLVDDIFFIEDIDLNVFNKFDTFKFIPSLRLGLNITRSYTKQTDMKLPVFTKNENDLYFWEWKNGEHYWKYPLSVDGNIFNKNEILILTKNIEFNSPNSFEGNLQFFNNYFINRQGICFKKSKILNIPANKVQKDFDNIHGNIHQDFLLENWKSGFQIDYKKFNNITNISPHQEFDFIFIKR